MVEFAGGKMSKSVGNLVTIDAFLSNYDADVFRMMVLSSGYRLPLKFADDLVHSTKQKLARLRKAIDPVDKPLNTLADPTLPQDCKDLVRNFESAMDDDFNAPAALGYLFDFARLINSQRNQDGQANYNSLRQQTLLTVCRVLGLRFVPGENMDLDEAVSSRDELIRCMLRVRADLKQEKDWRLADLIRDELLGLGIKIEDTAEGPKWSKLEN
jgi:cysteinyl-tRNA synthetase